MSKEKDCIRDTAREVAELIPYLHRNGRLGSAREYAAFYGRIVVGFADLLTTDRELLTQAERVLLREMADNPLIGPLSTNKDLEHIFRCMAG